MTEPRVLVCGWLPGAGLRALTDARCDVDHDVERGAGGLADVIGPYEGVIVHSKQLVNRETLDASARLRVVGRAGAGVDNIDISGATARGILVLNVPGGNTVSAAEHTIALILSMVRNIPAASASLRAGRWERAAFLGIEIHGKTLGIIGLGRIGREVACRARAFGLEIVATDPAVEPATAVTLGIELTDFDDLLARADIVTVHVPLSASTRHMIDGAAIARMKPGARLVNCARGGLVDEEAVLRGLDSGHLAGAAVDVFESEPAADPALLAHPRFVGTPHIGGATIEARERVGAAIARNVAAALVEGVVRDAVNEPRTQD